MAETSASPSSSLQGVTFEGNEFASLLSKEFKPKTGEAKSAVEQAVPELLLERADLEGHGRLGHLELLRRLGERALVHDRAEGEELVGVREGGYDFAGAGLSGLRIGRQDVVAFLDLGDGLGGAVGHEYAGVAAKA